MCKAASPPPPPTTEVAEEIKNTTSVDNSWSFINIHLPSAVTTTIVIIIVLIATWTLLRLYNRFAKARQPTDQTRPGQPPATSPPTTSAPAWPVPPTPWPSPPTAPTRASTSLTHWIWTLSSKPSNQTQPLQFKLLDLLQILPIFLKNKQPGTQEGR